MITCSNEINHFKNLKNSSESEEDKINLNSQIQNRQAIHLELELGKHDIETQVELEKSAINAKIEQ